MHSGLRRWLVLTAQALQAVFDLLKCLAQALDVVAFVLVAGAAHVAEQVFVLLGPFPPPRKWPS